MNNKDMYNMLNDMRLKDIKILTSMCIQYMIMKYGVKFKEILKDIKAVNKLLESRYR